MLSTSHKLKEATLEGMKEDFWKRSYFGVFSPDVVLRVRVGDKPSWLLLHDPTVFPAELMLSHTPITGVAPKDRRNPPLQQTSDTHAPPPSKHPKELQPLHMPPPFQAVRETRESGVFLYPSQPPLRMSHERGHEEALTKSSNPLIDPHSHLPRSRDTPEPLRDRSSSQQPARQERRSWGRGAGKSREKRRWLTSGTSGSLFLCTRSPICELGIERRK
ncbi:hypothetical protein K402DRAFT_400241 [Aulographum hederae CBS 113979]|uniref:Uncharacterized protein n=1 Tax=Aulographum hederae CBS 113979 TaxID=1176131 RepID=A0A6G1HEK7_9PEZI|nr:hypothetical protein K402DRAFT_400241 [Aulographum hederae CBS 113979]